MLFNSIEFLLFLPLVLFVYFILPTKKRWIFLLFASYFFYAGWKVSYLGLIIYSTLLDYFISNAIYATNHAHKKKILLIISLVSNFAVLILFKYFHFFIGGGSWFKSLAQSNDFLAHLQIIFDFGIPVGISFYTFQTVSYTIDVYRGDVIPERNVGKFALFVSYFPQLVAGPIERFNHLHPQLFNDLGVRKENWSKGLRLMLYGFFMKMVIADNIAPIIEPLFNQPEQFSYWQRILGVILFGQQIYADFSGYTFIAIGIALLMNVNLTDNFKAPYFSISTREFWSRWHISLSRWFMSYLYIPLGGNRKGKIRWAFAILIVFMTSGLWHGADATFIWWGMLHGIYFVLEQFVFPVKEGKKITWFERIIRWLATFSVVNFLWLFFRVGDFKIFNQFFHKATTLNAKSLDIPLTFIAAFLLFLICEIATRKMRMDSFLNKVPLAGRLILYSLFILLITTYAGTGSMQFIYFQF